MAKQQKIQNKKTKLQPQIIDERSRALQIPQESLINENVADLPLRTIIYVEVGSMEPARVQLLMQAINKEYANSKGGIHYVIPIRNGKIGTDIVFENEFLNIVKEICEISNGEIVLKDGAKDCHIIRNKV